MTVVATKWTGGFMALTYMCNKYGDLFENNCNTISAHPLGFKECYWTNSWKLPLYIEESCYKSLTDSEKAIARSNGKGMVKDGIWKTFVRVEQYGNRYKFNPDAVIPYPDICKGVVCEDICINADKYSQECMTEGVDAGKCVFDDLIKANDPSCPGYVDPCEGVTCDDECFGVDLHKTVCEEGVCIKGVLIKADDPGCGYVPPPPDPCEGVVCDDECFGVDKHETVCEDGVCIRGVLIKADDPGCGYVPPDPDPDPPVVCNEGELRGATVCKNGQVVYAEICQNDKWVATGDRCPEDPDPDPDPDPDSTDWMTYALIGAALVLFWLLATRGSS